MTFTPADLALVRARVRMVWATGHADGLPSDAQPECEARVLVEIVEMTARGERIENLGAVAYSLARQTVAKFYRQQDTDSPLRRVEEGKAVRRDSEVIQAVREHGGVTAAAQALGISRQAVHKHLRNRRIRSGRLGV